MLLAADLFERVSMNAHRSAKFCRDWAAMQPWRAPGARNALRARERPPDKLYSPGERLRRMDASLVISGSALGIAGLSVLYARRQLQLAERLHAATSKQPSLSSSTR